MIESIVLGTLAFLTLLFLSLYLLQVKKNRIILANTLQLLIMQQSIHDENKTDKEKSNEDFLKFVSDSRDWAYQYIEDVQTKINNFITDIEPEIAYFDEYGVASSAYPHYHSMKKISEAYKELKTALPEDYDRIE
jgi:alpha-L-fucosidase